MAGHRDPWILCDRCFFHQFPEDAGESSYVNWTIRQLRAAAKEGGWRFTRDGRDLCPECVQKGVA